MVDRVVSPADGEPLITASTMNEGPETDRQALLAHQALSERDTEEEEEELARIQRTTGN